MLIVHDAWLSRDLPRKVVATIGNFDGVHRGHQSILEQVRLRARALGLLSVVVTFEPHPLEVLHPEGAPSRITTAPQKLDLFDRAGLDAVLVVDFNPDFARTSAEDFVSDLLVNRLQASELHVGSSFVFGHDREGNLALLERQGATLGFTAHGIDEVTWQGEPISSSRIRSTILAGRTEDAMEMLGRPFTVTGIVARGDRMGKRIGWPTINLTPDHELLPADGVYTCRVSFPTFPATFDCVTNIGTRPTVYENYRRVVESHILDFRADVYGEPVQLAFYKRLREEMIFPTVMDLSAQIGRDVEATREFFALRRRLDTGGSPAQEALQGAERDDP